MACRSCISRLPRILFSALGKFGVIGDVSHRAIFSFLINVWPLATIHDCYRNQRRNDSLPRFTLKPSATCHTGLLIWTMCPTGWIPLHTLSTSRRPGLDTGWDTIYGYAVADLSPNPIVVSIILRASWDANVLHSLPVRRLTNSTMGPKLGTT